MKPVLMILCLSAGLIVAGPAAFAAAAPAPASASAPAPQAAPLYASQSSLAAAAAAMQPPPASSPNLAPAPAQVCRIPSSEEAGYQKEILRLYRNLSHVTTGNADQDFMRLSESQLHAITAFAEIEMQFGKDPEMLKIAQKALEANRAALDALDKWAKDHKVDQPQTVEPAPLQLPVMAPVDAKAMPMKNDLQWARMPFSPHFAKSPFASTGHLTPAGTYETVPSSSTATLPVTPVK